MTSASLARNVAAIKKAEDRLFFKDAMQKIGPRRAQIGAGETARRMDLSSRAKLDFR